VLKYSKSYDFGSFLSKIRGGGDIQLGRRGKGEGRRGKGRRSKIRTEVSGDKGQGNTVDG